LRIRFLGAAGTVTGSRFLLETPRSKVLVDCGLFQGQKKLRERNWNPLPLEPSEISTVVLTHGHLDHCGWLPRLVRDGFEGRVLGTAPTTEIAKLILADSGRLQEEQAEYANRKAFSKHSPALPLYTEEDAKRAIGRLSPAPYEEWIEAAEGVRVLLRSAGHILGSTSVLVEMEGEGGSTRRVLVSGDLGQDGEPMMTPAAPIGDPVPDAILVECTYGGRSHREQSLDEALTQAVNDVVARRGIALIPAFAIGRTTLVLYRLEQLERAGAIPEIPIYVDSPMAVSANEVYCHFGNDPNLAVDLRTESKDFCPLRDDNTHYVRSTDESKRLNGLRGPAIIVSASGMLTGGRVIHHLKRLLPEERNKILLVGYQAAGTRGWRLQQGEEQIKMHGKWVPRRADVQNIQGFSAHGDERDVLDWLSTAAGPPKRTFLVHGEDESLAAMQRAVQERLGWPTAIPDYLDSVELDRSPRAPMDPRRMA
jgi:metallo-beta-lactamase family protein